MFLALPHVAAWPYVLLPHTVYSVHNVCRDEGVYPVIRGFFFFGFSAREIVEIGHVAMVPHSGRLREDGISTSSGMSVLSFSLLVISQEGLLRTGMKPWFLTSGCCGGCCLLLRTGY